MKRIGRQGLEIARLANNERMNIIQGFSAEIILALMALNRYDLEPILWFV